MRILIIEDNQDLASGLKKNLEDEGYAVDYLLDGEEGERRIQINHDGYDLLILDLVLPHKDGFAICKSIRQSGIKIPILILTGRFDVKDKVTLLNSGADDYLVKPFFFEELNARVKALLRRPAETITESLKVNDICINLNTHRAYRDSKELPLTLKEFSLMEYFMRNPGQTITREQILDHLWDFGFASFSNIVDVHIKNLRKKIGNNSRENMLETIRGVGYRLNVYGRYPRANTEK
ncbi:MAG: response regulator transcription factor [Candidatus Yanofskybacteria bacterium]|nr:response regulator transcription factor [Candidatus Yanofskybacteria bacterium]